jgi:hypothetical protein
VVDILGLGLKMVATLRLGFEDGGYFRVKGLKMVATLGLGSCIYRSVCE